MSSVISLEGLLTVGGNEDRALADIKVEYNDTTYLWKIYIPQGTVDLGLFLEASKSKIEADIDTKEAEWAALDPKTRTFVDPFTNETTVVDIQKDEIVKPTIPDYYALRRNEYPMVTKQLDALWKGPGSSDYEALQNEILQVKQKYPNPNASSDPGLITENIVIMTQKRLDDFARTRNYDSIVSACTYMGSPVPKFAQEAAYAVEARSLTWAKLYEMLGEVEAGTRPMPTGYSDIEPELPTLQWPA